MCESCKSNCGSWTDKLRPEFQGLRPEFQEKSYPSKESFEWMDLITLEIKDSRRGHSHPTIISMIPEDQISSKHRIDSVVNSYFSFIEVC